MTETVIKINTFADVGNFVTMCAKCANDVLVYSGKYIVSGKSMMGMYSLNLSEPIKVEFNGDIPDEVKEGMKKFIYEG